MTPLLRGRALARQAGVVHGFSTRKGGVSTGARRSLNLARGRGDPAQVVDENWRRALASLHAELSLADLALVHQVHGDAVVVVERGRGPGEVVAEADALITDRPAVVLAVRTADCVPILLSGFRGVGAVHAGWRGAAAGVLPRAIRALCELCDCPPAAVVATVGPHIGPQRYEVGPEVVQALRSPSCPAESFSRPGPRGRPMVDLGVVIDRQLMAAGVQQREFIPRCTASDPGLYSHRADGPHTGRQAALIARVSN